MPSDARTRGLYGKYRVEKTNGNPIDHEADYFVLRIDNDPQALRAAMFWAVSTGNIDLSIDLLRKLRAQQTEDPAVDLLRVVLRTLEGRVLGIPDAMRLDDAEMLDRIKTFLERE